MEASTVEETLPVSEELRAAALTQAATFLSNDAVQKSTDGNGKKNFLLNKGVRMDEIEEAFKRAGLEMPAEEPVVAAESAVASDGAQKQDHPYSNKFFAVLQAVQKGETLPGIKEVDDSARDDVTVTHKGDKARPLKPWEKKKEQAAAGGSVFDRKREEKANSDPLGASKLTSVPKATVAPPVSCEFTPVDAAKWESTDLKVSQMHIPMWDAERFVWGGGWQDYDGSDPSKPILVSIKGRSILTP